LGETSFVQVCTTWALNISKYPVHVSVSPDNKFRTKQELADISRSGYVVIATKPVHWLQIRPIVHN